MDLLQGLEDFFTALPLLPGEGLVVAFSGGGDSTALLWGLARLAPVWSVRLLAAHLDHGMDAGSAARAAHAGRLARQIGVPLVSRRHEMARWRDRGESLEAAARRVRYEYLEEVRRRGRARYVVTAHHRGDQAETVLLRLAAGSGLRGLAAIQPVHGTVLRPLLDLAPAGLRAAVSAAGLTPVADPGNADPRQPRSRVRHHLLPALAAGWAGAPCGRGTQAAAGAASPCGRATEGGPSCDRGDRGDRGDRSHGAAVIDGLARLAARARHALPLLDRRLAAAIDLRPAVGAADDAELGVSADWRRLLDLPESLLLPALALLHRHGGAVYPAGRAPVRELHRQLRRAADAAARGAGSAGGIACDCGDGWRWLGRGGRLHLRRTSRAETAPSFTYTLELPGALAIPEVEMVVRASEVEAEGWMWRGDPHRAAIKLPAPRSQGGPAAPAGRRLTVRSRRAGDRLWPLGAPGSRKLKEVLIDRGIPRWQRDRLPLLCWGEEIAWVPGVTIDHRFRLDGRGAVCLVELAPGAGRPPGGNQCPAREVHTTGGTTRFRGVVEPGPATGPAEPAPPARHGASIRLARHAPGEETQL